MNMKIPRYANSIPGFAISCFGFGRNRGEIAKVVIFTAIGNRFEVLGISPVSNADTSDLPLLCHIHSLLFFHNGVIGKLVAGDPATLFHKPDDSLRIGICLRDLIQCILDEIMIFHVALPLSGIVFTRSKDGMQ